MARVALDASVIIAFLDPADAQHEASIAAVRPHLDSGASFCTSASVFAEVLVRPVQTGSEAVVEEFFDAVPIDVVPVDRELARRAAALRAAHHGLRLPDAMVVAAAQVQAAELLTFDKRMAPVAAALDS